MDVAAYTQALVRYAEQINSITPLETERDALFAKLTGGTDGKSLVNSGVNGKTFGWQVNLTLEDKFRAFVDAITIFNNVAGDSPITFPDFSRSSGGGGYCAPICP